jgi:hypothetical protein
MEINTPQQALDIINQVRLKYTASGADHDVILQAIKVLAEAIRPAPVVAVAEPPTS